MEIQEFKEFPSSSEAFSSQIESKCVPAVFRGLSKDWKAFSNWNPHNGGLDYLQERAGSSMVEVMLSRSAPVFYGDLRGHERVPLPFSTFITFCKWFRHNSGGTPEVNTESEGCSTSEDDSEKVCLTSADAHQVYLAQVPILNIENREKSQLDSLQDDIQMPAFMEGKPLASINLWMNIAQSRSSTHYDPYHNLLCVIAGCKQVLLWSPSASAYLYPMPVYGEASNHSAVELDNPDLQRHSRAKYYMDYSQKIILHAGDSVFIPEGWFHQVDSKDLTIAVNFWWQSNMNSSMLEHMDAYFLRRIIRRLVDNEMSQMLHPISLSIGKAGEDVHLEHGSGLAGDSNRVAEGKSCIAYSSVTCAMDEMNLKCLEPHALQALHQLVSLVHESVNVCTGSQPDQSSPRNVVDDSLKHKSQQNMRAVHHLEDDPVANIFWTLKPLVLRKIFLVMVGNFPRTLEALIVHMLTSVGAEVLTRKFDEMDQQTTKEEQSEFYRLFYGVFDDHFTAMDAILSGKESFAAEAFRNVLDKYLGVNMNQILGSWGHTDPK